MFLLPPGTVGSLYSPLVIIAAALGSLTGPGRCCTGKQQRQNLSRKSLARPQHHQGDADLCSCGQCQHRDEKHQMQARIPLGRTPRAPHCQKRCPEVLQPGQGHQSSGSRGSAKTSGCGHVRSSEGERSPPVLSRFLELLPANKN